MKKNKYIFRTVPFGDNNIILQLCSCSTLNLTLTRATCKHCTQPTTISETLAVAPGGDRQLLGNLSLFKMIADGTEQAR